MKTIKLDDVKGVKALKAGDTVSLSGTVYTARDAAHKKLFNALKYGEEVPFVLNDSIIFYVGACTGTVENKDGSNGIEVLSAGPTTAMRMDAYAPALYDVGVLATIGKGDRSREVYAALRRNGGVYFAAIGGAGALYGGAVRSAELVAYPELGTESIYRFEVEDFPVVVAIDSKGNSIYS